MPIGQTDGAVSLATMKIKKAIGLLGIFFLSSVHFSVFPNPPLDQADALLGIPELDGHATRFAGGG
jgi:hypothetical protein